MTRVAIVGAGISGLATARALVTRAPRVEVLVLEGGRRVGGNIRTEHIDGFVCESGPDGFLDNAPATLQLVRELGLESRLQRSNDAARRRFIFHNRRLREVPTSAFGLATTGLLSPGGKVRLALEPVARRRQQDDESIHEFASRRIGEEAASILVDAMVSGIFAGDSRHLSLAACFPRMRELEDRHGSLFRALFAMRHQRRGDTPGAPAGRLTSFVGGMTELVDGLAGALDGVVRTDSPALQVQTVWSGVGRHHYIVATPHGSIHADAVVLAGPASVSAQLLAGSDDQLAGLLAGIPTAPLAVVSLGFDACALGKRSLLDGFGFLVPRRQGIRILGALCETTIYPNRAPSGKVLVRVMIGGACDPDAVVLDDVQLRRTVLRDLAAAIGIATEPEFIHIVRHTRGIPQFVTGHLARMQQIDARLEEHQGLHLAGNSYRSPSVNACIAEANGVATAVLRQLAERPVDHSVLATSAV